MAILEVKNLNLGFQCEDIFRQALYDVNFALHKGKMLSLVGESGCGKTMSAMSILNLLPKTARITSGEILYNGENLLLKNNKQMQNVQNNPSSSSISYSTRPNDFSKSALYSWRSAFRNN